MPLTEQQREEGTMPVTQGTATPRRQAHQDARVGPPALLRRRCCRARAPHCTAVRGLHRLLLVGGAMRRVVRFAVITIHAAVVFSTPAAARTRR